MRWLSAVVSAFILGLCSLARAQSFSQCARVHACSATLNTYPYTEQDSSGWGSGEVPLYDELLSSSISFDYTSIPESETFQLCECPNNATCENNEETRNLKLDNHVTLTFCEDVAVQVYQECKGIRGRVRVIGSSHSSGAMLATVTQSLVFCNCPSGFKRDSPEMWGHEMAIQYKFTCCPISKQLTLESAKCQCQLIGLWTDMRCFTFDHDCLT